MKKYLFGILAVSFAIVFVAFTPAANTKDQATGFEWFVLKEGKSFADRFDPAAYEPFGETICESHIGLLCGVFAEKDENDEPLIKNDILAKLEYYVEGSPVAGYIAERDEE
ncbi:MAG TPA: hypothetical protein VK483_06150 [Chitinophagaceae bacterium]|nr:hypothetical protein [Chitinophagaceae bacterium]